jgi:hypothetical protein
VNVSAPALTREGEVQSKIRKVRTFGRIARIARIARVVCAAIFGFGLYEKDHADELQRDADLVI